MGPLATWSLIGAVVLLLVHVLYVALARMAARGEDRMDQRWLERQWLADLDRHIVEKDGVTIVTNGLPGNENERPRTYYVEPSLRGTQRHPLYDQDEEAP